MPSEQLDQNSRPNVKRMAPMRRRSDVTADVRGCAGRGVGRDSSGGAACTVCAREAL